MTAPTLPVDLRADIHGHAIDFANDQDRRYFRDHPEAMHYRRAPIEHEICPPGGPCRPMGGLVINVVNVADGVRFRMPVRIRR